MPNNFFALANSRHHEGWCFDHKYLVILTVVTTKVHILSEFISTCLSALDATKYKLNFFITCMPFGPNMYRSIPPQDIQYMRHVHIFFASHFLSSSSTKASLHRYTYM